MAAGLRPRGRVDARTGASQEVRRVRVEGPRYVCEGAPRVHRIELHRMIMAELHDVGDHACYIYINKNIYMI